MFSVCVPFCCYSKHTQKNGLVYDFACVFTFISSVCLSLVVIISCFFFFFFFFCQLWSCANDFFAKWSPFPSRIRHGGCAKGGSLEFACLRLLTIPSFYVQIMQIVSTGQGAAAVGIRGTDSVVLAVEKRTTAKLQVLKMVVSIWSGYSCLFSCDLPSHS